MAEPQRFRTAFRGFNREDVVNYIEYLNNQHNAQLEQLRNQLHSAQAAINPEQTQQLQKALDDALARCAELEAKLHTDEEQRELETYRRAERAERQARERARQIYDQASAVLNDATAKADSAADQIGRIAEDAARQLQAYQSAVSETAESFRDAVAALYDVKCDEE